MSTPKANIHQQILDNLNRLKNDRVQIDQLLELFRQEINTLKLKEIASETPELAQVFKEAGESIQGSHKAVFNWCKEFELELVRVEEALGALEKSDIEAVKTAFAQFVLTDSAFSVKNIALMFYDYERLLEAVRSLYGGDTKSVLDTANGSVSASDNEPFSQADYEAVKQIAIRNGGRITIDEILSVIVRGYVKALRIRDQLEKDGIIKPGSDERAEE